MESQGKDESQQISNRTPSAVRYQTRATYDTLVRRSRKLGQKAMRTMEGASLGNWHIFGQKRDVDSAPANDIDELKKVISHAHEVITKAGTVLPFMFPDEIILDRTKITIIKRNFVLSSNVISMRIEDVLNVSATVGPMFGSITISSRVMNTVDHFDIGRFWREDATRMKKILQGYLIAKQNGVDTDHLSCSELAKTLFEIDSTE